MDSMIGLFSLFYQASGKRELVFEALKANKDLEFGFIRRETDFDCVLFDGNDTVLGSNPVELGGDGGSLFDIYEWVEGSRYKVLDGMSRWEKKEYEHYESLGSIPSRPDISFYT